MKIAFKGEVVTIRYSSDLHEEYYDTSRTIYDLLDALDAVEVLRSYTPATTRYLVDRLESALRRIDRIEDDLNGPVA